MERTSELQGTSKSLIPQGPPPPPPPPPLLRSRKGAERDHPCLPCKTDNGEIAVFLFVLPLSLCVSFSRRGNLILVGGESICSQRIWSPASANSDRVGGSSVQTRGRMHQMNSPPPDSPRYSRIYPKTCVFYSRYPLLHALKTSPPAGCLAEIISA